MQTRYRHPDEARLDTLLLASLGVAGGRTLRLRSGQAASAPTLADTSTWGQEIWYVECLYLRGKSSDENVIRSYKGVSPTIPASCFVDESAQIIGDVMLGEHASVWMNAVLRGDVHEIRIGAYSNVQDNSVLHGMKQQWGVYLGEYVTVGHSVTLHGCVIEDRCLIGMGSIILNGARIGAGSIIAAGTLIPEGTIVEPASLWMGSPGKFRRKLEESDQETIMRYARNYLEYKDEYLREK